MIFDPSPGHQGLGQKKAVACPIRVRNSRTKFGWILSNGLGSDSIMDGQIDGGNYNIGISPLPLGIMKSTKSNQINSFLLDFCHLLITYANSLDPDQNRQDVGPQLNSNSLTL